nr:replication protein [Mercurialis latent virus]
MDLSQPSLTSGSDVVSLNVNDLVSSYINHARSDESTSVGRFLGEVALKEIRSQVDTSNGDFQKLNVGFHMTPDEKASMKHDFPGLDICFKDSCQSSHSYAAAHRICETQEIYNRFQTKTEKIIDLGGNYVTHAKQGRSNVHSCCPILDVRDAARHSDRYISLAAAVERRHKDLPVDFCCNRFEDCHVKAPYAMAIHSVSDIPIATVAKHCLRRGVRKLIASVMMDPLMLMYSSGNIPLLNVDWEKHAEVIAGVETGKTLISFHFVDAPGLSYTHDFDILCQYMTSNQVIVNDSYTYRVERTACLSGVYIVEFTLGMTDGVTRAHLKPMRDMSCAWLNTLRKKVFVKLAIPISDSGWYEDPFEIRWALLDEKLVRYVSEAAFRQYSKDKNPETLVQYIATILSSSSNHVVINGVTMRSGSPIYLEEYVPLAVTFYAQAAWRYKNISAGLNAVKTKIPKEIDRVGPSGRIVNAEELTGVQKLGLNLFRRKTIVKSSDDSHIVYSRDCLAEIWHEIKSIFGLTLDQQEDYMDVAPSHVKAMDVWRACIDVGEFPGCIVVEECVSKLMETHKLMTESQRQQEEKEAQLNDARDEALMKIARVIEKDSKVKDGLTPILDLCKIKDDLEAACNKLSLNVDSIRAVSCPSVQTNTTVNPYADSIKEAIAYFNEAEVVNTRNLRSLGNYLFWRPATSAKNYDAMYGRNESVRIYEPLRDKWYGASTNFISYERAMTEDGYVSLQWQNGILSNECKKSLSKYNIALVDETCIFNSGMRMIPALEASLKMKPNFQLKIVDGVAGCGKTTYLKTQARMDHNPDIILTSNRSSSDELKEKVNCPEAMKYRIRTVDSYLMLKNWFSAKRLLFDECFLTHAGCVYAAATLSQVEEVIALGDTEQVPFISRLPEFQMNYHKVQGEIEKQTTTYRCPIDATAALGKMFYKNKIIKTASKVDRSLFLKPIVSSVQIPYREDCLYMTHTRADKDALLKTPGFSKANVKTTHEAQGDTWDHVVMFRLSRTTNLLHSGKEPKLGPCHNLVAISRHRKQFEYYTVASNDADDQLLRAINMATNFSKSELDEFRLFSRR